jgi:HK97 gp10 family phage protein
MISPEEFAARLMRSPLDAEDVWKREWAEKVAEEMRRNAPVDTGALRESIQATSDGVQVGVRYGAYVEYGTSRTAPQPFTGPSVARLRRPATEDAVRKVIRSLTS